MISELPLVVEFVIRNGCKELFLRVLAEANPDAAYVPLLRQMEEMVAFEFMLFTYEQLSFSANQFGQSARRRSQEIMQTKPGAPYAGSACGVFDFFLLPLSHANQKTSILSLTSPLQPQVSGL